MWWGVQVVLQLAWHVVCGRLDRCTQGGTWEHADTFAGKRHALILIVLLRRILSIRVLTLRRMLKGGRMYFSLVHRSCCVCVGAGGGCVDAGLSA